MGEPRNPDDLRARYVIYDDETREVFFRCIDFDANLYRTHLQATTLVHTPYFLQVLSFKLLRPKSQSEAVQPELKRQGICRISRSSLALLLC